MWLSPVFVVDLFFRFPWMQQRGEAGCMKQSKTPSSMRLAACSLQRCDLTFPQPGNPHGPRWLRTWTQMQGLGELSNKVCAALFGTSVSVWAARALALVWQLGNTRSGRVAQGQGSLDEESRAGDL